MQLVISGLRCRYPRAETDAVDVEELVLKAGTTGLVGVNGAGKSTLLMTLAGARRPQSGSVTVDDVDLYGARRRDVLPSLGFMPQTLTLPREMRVHEAMAYASWIRGVPASTAEKRNSELLDQVGLADRAKDRVGRTSGGMQRRLTLAMALVTDPRILLLDEPTTGLDPEQRAALRTLVGALPESAITLLSSHVMEDVDKMARDIAVMADGRLVHHGSTRAFVEERGGPDSSAEFAFLSTVARAQAR